MVDTRFIQRAYARAFGYFWLPCTVCGREYGGHEWEDIDGLPSSVPDLDVPGLGHGICPVCTAQGYGYPPGFDAHARPRPEAGDERD